MPKLINFKTRPKLDRMKKLSRLIGICGFTLFTFTLFFSSAQAQKTETGTAVYYADYLHGQSTAHGEIYNKYELTCAHKSHPLGTLLRVTRLDTKKSVVVRVNDRGPYADNLLIDLSWAAADKIDLVRSGKATVRVEPVGYSATNPHNPDKPTGHQYKYAGNPAFSATNSDFAAKGVPTAPATTKSKKNKNGENVFDPNEVRLFPKGQTGYAIQVASYTNYSNAQRYVIGWQQQGVQHLYLKYDQAEALYRVIIAPFNQKVNAINYLMEMKSQHGMDGLVIMLRE